MKTYRIGEVLKILAENPDPMKKELSFITTDEIVRVHVRVDGLLVFENKDHKEVRLSVYAIKSQWKRFYWPLKFEEAMNSKRKIRSEFWTEYLNADSVLKKLNKAFHENALKCINGRWYEEPEEE